MAAAAWRGGPLRPAGAPNGQLRRAVLEYTPLEPPAESHKESAAPLIDKSVLKADGAHRGFGPEPSAGAGNPSAPIDQRTADRRPSHPQLHPGHERPADGIGHQNIQHQLAISPALPQVQSRKPVLAAEREAKLRGEILSPPKSQGGA